MGVARRAMQRVWRLGLECGHTAFVGRKDEHRVGWAFFCHACEKNVKIETSADLGER